MNKSELYEDFLRLSHPDRIEDEIRKKSIEDLHRYVQNSRIKLINSILNNNDPDVRKKLKSLIKEEIKYLNSLGYNKETVLATAKCLNSQSIENNLKVKDLLKIEKPRHLDYFQSYHKENPKIFNLIIKALG
jgi:ERCC4-related helicase